MNRRHLSVAATAAATTVAALAVSGCGVGLHFRQYRYETTPADAHLTGVTQIVVGANSGHVHITGGGNDGVTVHRVIRYQSGTPQPGQRVDGGVLTFVDGCSRCSVSYDITAPASVRVRAHADSGAVDVEGVAAAEATSDSGAVTVRDVPGAVTARADSGAVIAENVGGALAASTSSGSIRTTGLRSPTARAASDSGSIRLAFTAAPSSVHATADSGSIKISVPGGPYAVDAGSDSGNKDIGRIATAPNARSTISVHTDSGSITVEPAS